MAENKTTKSPRTAAARVAKKARSAAIVIGADAELPTPIEVELVGETYTAHPPKKVFSIRLMRAATALKTLSKNDGEEGANDSVVTIEKFLNDWIEAVFAGDDLERVQARLDDNHDPLDMEHIMDLVTGIMSVGNDDTPGEDFPTT